MNSKARPRWGAVAVDPPKLSSAQWSLAHVLGIIFLAAAVLQIISLQDFLDNLSATGMDHIKWWAGFVLFGEFVASASFFKLRLSKGFRMVSNFFALFVCFFWFLETVRQVSGYADVSYQSFGLSHPWVADFFGKFLAQPLGWWPVVEIGLFTLLVINLLDLSRARSASIKAKRSR